MPSRSTRIPKAHSWGRHESYCEHWTCRRRYSTPYLRPPVSDTPLLGKELMVDLALDGVAEPCILLAISSRKGRGSDTWRLEVSTSDEIVPTLVCLERSKACVFLDRDIPTFLLPA